MRIAIVAALPGELKHLVTMGFKRLPASGKTLHQWALAMGEDTWIAVCAGMGAECARRAFAAAEAHGPLDAVLSIGWAGALDPEVSATQVLIASAVVDAQTGERFELSHGERKQVLVSTSRVAQEPEKRRLAATYGASMVDMESAAIVRLALMRGIPVCCVKAISDGLGDPLPDLNPFIANGQLQMLPFLSHVATRPRTWRPLLHLGRNSAAAAHTLASAVLNILRGPKDFDQINRTGNVDCES